MTFRPPDSVANALLDLFLGDNHSSLLTAASVDVCLFAGLPSDDDGTGLTEITGAGYVPVTLTNNSTNWPDAASRTKANGVTVAFPDPTAAWPLASTWGVRSSGLLVLCGRLRSPITAVPGSPATMPAGTLAITVPA